MRPCGSSHNKNDSSRINLNDLDLWGIVAIGDTIFCGGRSTLIFHRVTDVRTLILPFLCFQQKNGQWLPIPKCNRVAPSWLPCEFIPWSNCGQSWQGNFQSHTPAVFHTRGDGMKNLSGTCYFQDFEVVAAQLAKQTIPNEWNNITVVLSNPHGCGVFLISLVQHISSCACHIFYLLITLVD